jgi:Lon protease-like protein
MVQLAPHRLKAFCEAMIARVADCLAADELFMYVLR